MAGAAGVAGVAVVAGGMVAGDDDFDRSLSPFLPVEESVDPVDGSRRDNLIFIFETGATFSGTTNPPLFFLLTDASGVSEWIAFFSS